jgi:predicted DNA-binding ribbon-helix-helix protein
MPELAERAPDISAAYDTDFHRWTRDQAAALAARDHARLDVVNLLDEVESVGRSQRTGLESHLRVLLVRLLKFRVQPQRATPSWRHTLKAQRAAIARLIVRNPSLHTFPMAILDETYRDAVRDAAGETRIDPRLFPSALPFTLDQILDPEFEP